MKTTDAIGLLLVTMFITGPIGVMIMVGFIIFIIGLDKEKKNGNENI